MARIAYKEWKERKMEEEKQKKKMERMERRHRMIAMGGGHVLPPECIENARRMAAAANGGEVILAYGLNKNLKNLKN